MTKLLDRAALLQAPLLKITTVAVPELEGEILLRELSAADVQRLATVGQGIAEDDTLAHLRTTALLLSLCWVNEQGQRVMNGEEDIDTLLTTWPLGLLNRLGNAASVASGLVTTALDDAKKK